MGVLAHNEKNSKMWSMGGAAYDRVSASISDAIEHAVNRAWPTPGEQFLDVATGTGWTARQLARRGASVVGVDIAADMLAAAKQFAPDLTFHVGDAEALNFRDAEFDAVTSTFGVMFASRPEAVAAELARVVKPGGRLVLTTWRPDSAVADLFKVMKKYVSPQPTVPALPSPFEWGKEARLQELLGKYFDLSFEPGISVLRMPSGEHAWQVFYEGYGPTRTLADDIAGDKKGALRQDFIALHEQYREPCGIAMPRSYVVTVGKRK